MPTRILFLGVLSIPTDPPVWMLWRLCLRQRKFPLTIAGIVVFRLGEGCRDRNLCRPDDSTDFRLLFKQERKLIVIAYQNHEKSRSGRIGEKDGCYILTYCASGSDSGTGEKALGEIVAPVTSYARFFEPGSYGRRNDQDL